MTESPRVLRAAPLAAERMAETMRLVETYTTADAPVTLVTVLVGDDPASRMYVDMKQREAKELGMRSLDVRLDGDISQDGLEGELRRLSERPDIDGILVQYPLPKGLQYLKALQVIDPLKDVDGLHPSNLGMMTGGAPVIAPCTPRGILDLLEWYEIPVPSKKVAVVGRGLTVGRPVSILLSEKGPVANATVTALHTGSAPEDMAAAVADADIVVGAAGQPGLIKPEWIREGAVLIAAGVSFPEGKAVSDFADGCRDHASAFTPTTGGVGPMTRVWLFRNVVECRRLQNAR
ncbi:MAG: Methenyltetrahydrofolate cyclohydrolase [Ilumatobacteraceae bacterium]|nr:Methenyltetrahydrofolate cyclohydrolase [Ilumatobacteraceae bacterium]